jgi:phage terminase large subunit GpA-like protein
MSARDLPDHAVRASQLVHAALLTYLAPPPRVNVAEWAEGTRYVAKGPERGFWRNERTPYLVEPMECASSFSLYEQIVMMFATQLGKTEVIYNSILQRIANEPQDMMMVQPTLQDAKDHSTQRFLPTVLQTPALFGKVAVRKTRDETTSWRTRSIQGNFTLFFAGANSAASLASKPLGFAVADEVDKFPADVDGEGPPIGLLEERMSNFARKKLIICSTPTTKDSSEIERRYLASDRRRYWVPCPHCSEPQVLVWGQDKEYGIKYLKTAGGQARPETAVYVCMHCTKAIQEFHKTAMLADGRWRAEAPGAGRGKVAGFHLNKLYSPIGWRSWVELVEEWEEAVAQHRLGNSGPLKKFKNSSQAETWEEAGQGADYQILAKRAEPYELGKLPRGVLMLTMGVDTHPDRLEARAWGYGYGEESWLCARHIIYGDPNIEEGLPGSPWTKLTEIRATLLERIGGGQMAIEATAIDVQGHNTDAVYKYCRDHRNANVLAVRGDKDLGGAILKRPKLIDVTWRGKTAPRSLKLWNLCVDTAKHVFYGRLRLSTAGPGYIHVPESLRATDEFEGMCSERLMPSTVNGRQVMRWVNPPGKRNEPLDCAVYAYAAACFLGIQSMRAHGWERRRQKYAPEADLLSALDTYPKSETVDPETGEILSHRSSPGGAPPQTQTPATISFPRSDSDDRPYRARSRRAGRHRGGGACRGPVLRCQAM